MQRTDEDWYRLSTGRPLYANNGIVGLDVKNGGVFTGYDDDLSPRQWTVEERREFADFMIAAWTEWKERFAKENSTLPPAGNEA